jgi:hypothetical protein
LNGRKTIRWLFLPKHDFFWRLGGKESSLGAGDCGGFCGFGGSTGIDAPKDRSVSLMNAPRLGSVSDEPVGQHGVAQVFPVDVNACHVDVADRRQFENFALLLGWLDLLL